MIGHFHRLPNCNINAFGVMQIAEMVTNIGCVQDLNLDMNPNTQENYHLLCTPGGRQVLGHPESFFRFISK